MDWNQDSLFVLVLVLDGLLFLLLLGVYVVSVVVVDDVII